MLKRVSIFLKGTQTQHAFWQNTCNWEFDEKRDLY